MGAVEAETSRRSALGQAVLGVGLAFAVARAATLLDRDLHAALHLLAFHGGLSAARDLVANLLALSVTAVSVLVSITMSIVQGAAGQLSPRLVRPLLARALPPASLLLYVGTVAYSMALLYLLEGSAAVRPRVSVTLAMVATFASTLAASVHLLKAMQAVRLDDLLADLGGSARDACQAPAPAGWSEPGPWPGDPALDALRLLSDVGLRALSPAVNDPYTGIQALEASAPALERLATQATGGDGAAARRLGAALEITLGATLRYGASDPEVLAAVARVAGGLEPACPQVVDEWFDQLRQALREAAAQLARLAERALVEEALRAPTA